MRVYEKKFLCSYTATMNWTSTISLRILTVFINTGKRTHENVGDLTKMSTEIFGGKFSTTYLSHLIHRVRSSVDFVSGQSWLEFFIVSISTRNTFCLIAAWLRYNHWRIKDIYIYIWNRLLNCIQYSNTRTQRTVKR